MGKISWTDGVKNEVLPRFRRNNAVTRSKKNWSYILRRNCILGHVLEGRQKGREDEEEGVSSYWITVTKREHAGQRNSDFFREGNNYRSTREPSVHIITPHFRRVWKADDKSDCKLYVSPPFCPRGASRLPRD